MGVFACVEGRCTIVEYSDLPHELAAATDETGRLRLWAGNPAIHLFSVDFLTRMTADPECMPLHVARKKVPHIDAAGAKVDPAARERAEVRAFHLRRPAGRPALDGGRDKARRGVRASEKRPGRRLSRDHRTGDQRTWPPTGSAGQGARCRADPMATPRWPWRSARCTRWTRRSWRASCRLVRGSSRRDILGEIRGAGFQTCLLMALPPGT